MPKRVEKTESEWREELSDEEFEVCRQAGTEQAFTGIYHDSKDEGTYRCRCCDLELFTSDAKFDSGSGWPSFFEPVESDKVVTRSDASLGMVRTEVLCAGCDAHLGHVFPDGPAPTGLRYCMNSVSLKLEKP
jgi:peptide-methionine (R)-S-oxide reductase